MDHIGIDVHKKESQICILMEDGEVIERRIRRESERFAVVLKGKARALAGFQVTAEARRARVGSALEMISVLHVIHRAIGSTRDQLVIRRRGGLCRVVQAGSQRDRL